MISKTENGETFFEHNIKIDHPLCNNNPKAIVLAVKQADKSHLQAVNIFYNQADAFWYISTPDIRGRGFELDIIVDAHPTVIEGISGSEHPDFRKLENTPFQNTYGIAYAGPFLARSGSKVFFTHFYRIASDNETTPNRRQRASSHYC
jgi:hypothetical protein